MVKGIKGGRMMKSITATKQELKELMEKGFFVRSEPKKKGEQMVIPKSFMEQKPSASNGWNDYSKAEISNAIVGKKSGIADTNGELIKYIFEVGDVFSVKNKKGEKQWFCPKCGFHSGHNYNKHSEIIKLGEHSVKPLLVWLVKIEKGSNKSIGTTITKLDSWIKTFKRVKE